MWNRAVQEGFTLRVYARQHGAALQKIRILYTSVSQRPGRGPVQGPGINYTGPRRVVLEFVILVF